MVTHADLSFLYLQSPAHSPQLAEALVSVGEEGWLCPAESWPKADMAIKPIMAPLSVVCSMTQRDWRRWKPSFTLSCKFQGFGKERSGVRDVYGRIRYREGADCFHFTSLSTRNVLWPNQMSGFPEDPVYQSQEHVPPSCRHLLSPKVYLVNLVRKLKNNWVCGDKLCGFHL